MCLKMRLLIGAAVPMVLALPAAAQVTISTATTTPVSTSTANAGAASDVSITAAGSITLTDQDGATALTMDSNNSVTHAGTIALPDSDNATGVRIRPNVTGSFTSSGQINLLEDYTRTDTDNDGDLDGPLAIGTGRIGLLLEAGGPMNGNISLNGGSITVEGNNSAGVSLRSNLNGSYTQRGAITVVGSNSIGLDIRENVTGDVIIGGTTAANGENSIAVNVLGDVAGEFSIDGSVLATGFTSTTASNYIQPDRRQSTDKPVAERLDPDDLLVGGPAVAIRGNLGRGLLINGPAVGGVDPTPDVKDVIQNFNENRTSGTIQSFGSAPALLIQSLDGAAGGDIRLGLARESVRDTLDDDKDGDFTEIIGVFNYDYGFLNRGTIAATGQNIGFAATGARISGSADGTHQTIIDGGIFNGGTIASTAYEANAVGLVLGAGASTPRLVNTGAIVAATLTEGTHTATAVLVEQGASLTEVVNNGNIGSNSRGLDGNSVAFRDLSGTVSSFTNSSRINAAITDDNVSDDKTTGTGRAIALDLSRNTTGITLRQFDTVDIARINGDIMLGSGSDRFDLLSGEVVGKLDFGAGSDTLNINSARMAGDVTFGGTGAAVNLASDSILLGALSLGNAGGSLNFASGSLYDGAITRATGAAAPLSLAVSNATMINRATGALNLSSLSFTDQAKIGLVINNARIASGQPIFNVAGTANIGAGTVFTPVFEQFTTDPFTVRVLTANALTLGGSAEQMLNANSPFLYNLSLTRPTGTNALDLSVRVKTAEELGLNSRSASAYTGILGLLRNDDTVATALTSISNGSEFLRAASDILPAQDATTMRVLASNATAAFGATANRLDLIGRRPEAPGSAWVEEFGVYHEADASSDGLGVSGGGFGVAAGLDLIASRNWLIGGFISLESIEIEEQARTAAPLNMSQTSFGLYGGWRSGQLAVNAAAAYGKADFDSERRVSIGGLTDRLVADWSGSSYSASTRASYALPMGRFELTPYASADYVRLNQEGYTETSDAQTGLALVVDDGESSLATAGLGATLSTQFGEGMAMTFRPEISAGYRSVLLWDAPSSTVRFAGGGTGPAFALNPGQEPDNAFTAGLGLNVSGQFLNLKLGYDAEIADAAITHYGSITLRLAFW